MKGNLAALRDLFRALVRGKQKLRDWLAKRDRYCCIRVGTCQPITNWTPAEGEAQFEIASERIVELVFRELNQPGLAQGAIGAWQKRNRAE